MSAATAQVRGYYIQKLKAIFKFLKQFILEERTSVEKCSHKTDMWANLWFIHNVWCHPWADGAIQHNKVALSKYEEKPNKQYSPIGYSYSSFLQVPGLLKFLPWLSQLWKVYVGVYDEMNSFLSKLFLVMVLYHSNRNNKTEWFIFLWTLH